MTAMSLANTPISPWFFCSLLIAICFGRHYFASGEIHALLIALGFLACAVIYITRIITISVRKEQTKSQMRHS